MVFFSTLYMFLSLCLKLLKAFDAVFKFGQYFLLIAYFDLSPVIVSISVFEAIKGIWCSL